MNADFAGSLPALLMSYGMALPWYIAAGVGALLALVRWNRHPRVSMFALIGFGGILLIGLITVPLYQYLPRVLYGGHHDYQMASSVMTAVGLTSSLLHAVCYAFLIAAVFCGRKTEHSPTGAATGPYEPVAQQAISESTQGDTQ